MNTEEKAKAYDEALERAKQMCALPSDKATMEYIFPELCESEDEKIRKWLIEQMEIFHNQAEEVDSVGDIELTAKAIAYLEKQKDANKAIEAVERIDKYIDEHVENAHDMKDSHPGKKYYRGWDDALGKMAGILQDVYSGEKQKEQKPAEKETTLTGFEEILNTFLFDFANSPIEDCEPEDYIKKHSAEILKAAYKELNAKLQQDIFEAKQEGRREGYEAGKIEQRPAEWSEEDEAIFNNIIEKAKGGHWIEVNEITWLINRFKSLRPSWKPSEEQMDALKELIDDANRAGWVTPGATELYEQLKKLM